MQISKECKFRFKLEIYGKLIYYGLEKDHISGELLSKW